MTFPRLLRAVLSSVCWLLVSAVEDAIQAETAAPGPVPVTTPSGGQNSTHGGKSPGGLFTGLNVDSSMIQRALYVLIGITVIGVLYFLIRAVRLKRPVHKKKYGLLSSYEDGVEMEAVESDEDDTLYEARSLRR